MWASGFRVFQFRVWGLGFTVSVLGFWVTGSGNELPHDKTEMFPGDLVDHIYIVLTLS